MIKFVGTVFSILVISFLIVANCPAQIFFEDDFESGEIDTNKWQPTGGWSIVDADGPEELGKYVLYIDGGEAGISVINTFENIQYEADFRSGTGYSGFVFGAQDSDNNFYMHQISVTGSGHTPNNIRWHRKVAGAWNVEPIPFMNGVTLEQGVWYHVRFIMENVTFKVWVVELENMGAEPMVQIGEWSDSDENFPMGAIGFRSSGGEIMEYDNIVVGEIGGIAAVDPGEKLTATWGSLKK